MGVVEALKKGFETAMQLTAVMVIIFLFNALTAGLMLAVVGQNPTPELVQARIGILLLLFLLIVIAWVLLEGGVISSIILQIKTNNPGLEVFFGNCKAFFLRLFGLNALSGLIFVGLWVIASILVGVFVAAGGGQNPFFNAIGILLFIAAIIFSFFAAVPLLLSHYVMIMDNGAVFASLKKSIKTFKEYLGRFIGMFLLLGLILFGVSLVINMFGLLLGKLLPVGWLVAILNVLVSSFANGILSVYAGCCILAMIFSLEQPAAAESVKE